jgi:tRNA pseudouridine38-40 synthase
MPRYFLEVSYKGTRFSGFQIQQNANSIQAELQKAFEIIKKPVVMTGSSRTDSGVHAIQNYLHFDLEEEINDRTIYKLNAILPADIMIRNIIPVRVGAHCRYDAVSREYKYYIYRKKNPFLNDRAYYFPYKINIEAMEEAAGIIKRHTDFTSFSRRNTQVKSFECEIMHSHWQWKNDILVYYIEGNRFLRGMVRALTATMLKVGRNKMSVTEFEEIINAKNSLKASFGVPAHGLFLIAVNYTAEYFVKEKKN